MEGEAATVATDIKKRDPRGDAVLESLRNGTSILAACKGAGINPSTFWRWRQDDKELDAEAQAAVASRVMIVEDALYQACLKGNPTAIMFFLMNRASNEWKDKRAVPHLTASATAGVTAEVARRDGKAARERIGRSMRIIRSLGLEPEPAGQE